MKPEIYEREIIDGKPYFGIFYGSFIVINEELSWDSRENNPVYIYAKNILYNQHKAKFSGFEIRQEQFIEKPPSYFYLSQSYVTISLKFLVWGRAWKVRKLERKGAIRYKRVTRSGKRRWVKIHGKDGMNTLK